MSASWKTPSARRSRRSADGAADDEEDSATRLLAVVLAVPVFALSLYLGLITVTASPRLAAHIFLSLPLYFHFIYLGVAVAVAVRGGMTAITDLLGHLFFTHFESQRDRRKTLLLWGGLCLATVVAYALRQVATP